VFIFTFQFRNRSLKKTLFIKREPDFKRICYLLGLCKMLQCSANVNGRSVTDYVHGGLLWDQWWSQGH